MLIDELRAPESVAITGDDLNVTTEDNKKKRDSLILMMMSQQKMMQRMKPPNISGMQKALIA